MQHTAWPEERKKGEMGVTDSVFQCQYRPEALLDTLKHPYYDEENH